MSGARKRQAYWDSLLKKEKPKGFHWNKGKKGAATTKAAFDPQNRENAVLQLQKLTRGS